MKKILIIVFCFCVFSASSQGVYKNQVIKDLELKGTLRVGGKTVSNISTDSTLGAGSATSLVSEQAVKKYVDIYTPINVKKFGAKGNGTDNDSIAVNIAIDKANGYGEAVNVGAGTYKAVPVSLPKNGFTGNGSIVYNNFSIYKKDAYVGLPQNIRQKQFVYPTLITDGNLIDAPLATTQTNKAVDILAHWYNDFGLKRNALSSTEANGWHGWYDWRWNFTNNVNYDASRQPLLGWYRGDDPKVLDWQCYWLNKYGVVGTILTNVFRTTTWSNESDKSYWLYQLFNNVKNFKSLKYSVWLESEQAGTANAQQTDMINNILAVYKNVYCYEINGKKYPCFYMWDMEALRGIYDAYAGTANTVARLDTLAKMCRNLGYDGICILGRNMLTYDGAFSDAVRTDLKRSNVYLFSQDYSNWYDNAGATGYSNSFANYANTVAFPTEDYKILTVMTSAKSQYPHPSGWTLEGTTPALFKTALQKAVNQTAVSKKPQMVVVYNVSEWAEAGPGLQPQQRDGFGYLEAVASIGPSTKTTIKIDDIKRDILANSEEFYAAKVNNVTVLEAAGGATVVDMGYMTFHAGKNKANYVFQASLDFAGGSFSSATNVKYFVQPEFGSGRCYVTIYNAGASSIAGVGVSLFIRKIQ